jgi:hypothetical protein
MSILEGDLLDSFRSKTEALPMLSYQDWGDEGFLVLKGDPCGTLRKREDEIYLEPEPAFRWPRFSFTCSVSDEDLGPLLLTRMKQKVKARASKA